jgi:hypothetical protein
MVPLLPMDLFGGVLVFYCTPIVEYFVGRDFFFCVCVCERVLDRDLKDRWRNCLSHMHVDSFFAGFSASCGG